MISIVVPVYNSEKTLKSLTARIVKTMEDNHYAYEIILVNDGSHDQSYFVMCDLYKLYKSLICIDMKENYGQQNALLCGLRHGCGNYFITIDDDLQYQPEEIPRLLGVLLKKEYDVVYGIPYEKKHSLFRNFGTLMTNLLFTILMKKPWGKKVSSFRVMKKNLVEKIIKDQSSKVYLSAATLLNTRNIGNAFVCHKARKKGKSNYNFSKLFILYKNIIIYYYNHPIFIRMRKKKEQYIIREVLQ